MASYDNTNIVKQLIGDEGEINHAYQDSRGYWTIGIGTLIDAKAGGSITHDEAMYLCTNRINIARDNLLKEFPWVANLNDVKMGVLLNMTFNMGIGGLAAFRKMLQAFQNGNDSAVVAEMEDSQWAKQVGDRAKRLEQQVTTGQWVFKQGLYLQNVT